MNQIVSNFVTCDLLDDNPNCQVCSPNMEGKRFFSYGGLSSFGGEVVTVKCFEDNSRVKEMLACQGCGKVLVVDGGASMRCALLGDMIAKSALNNGWVGVIVYGCVRDVDELANMTLGVQALGSIPRKSNRQGVGEIGVTLQFGGITIEQGQFIYADNNGIIVSNKPLI
ncbi:ribonuclease activity regulator protein RraA [Moraxella macacae 0408225]|uniref:4-hydroxy-4-methyl-2-oxoglutarate aldolase n=1 Tax=Moraxella macacae 0408225 TaxID=1230338 RepID=L2F6K3_9GAMM|nr:ribonuclease E activity regulator RraA [Moraxella macacae]ELA08540.1 ribonuclease activity regulator protein RraA [Moraxella macacae 0408225]